jgi:hypothetical protein
MSLMEFAEFVQLFRLPIACGAVALAAVLAGLVVRGSDSPWTEWPREEQ